MKYLVKHIIRAAGIVNRHDLVVRNWSPRKVMDLYLGVRHLFSFPCLSSDKKRSYEIISCKIYYNVFVKTEGKTIWGAVIECTELVGLVWYSNNSKCKFMYIFSFSK